MVEAVRVSLDFRNTEIADVLRLLARQYNLNIVMSNDVKGPISIRLSNVTIDEALEAIITVNGFSYTTRGHVIRVTTAVAVEAETPESQVFKLGYADAKKLLDPLKAVLSSKGVMQADDRSNSLVVTDIPSALTTIGRVVENLDTPTAQVLIETKIIETALNDDEKLGISWEVLASLQGSAQPLTFPFPQRIAGSSLFDQFRALGQTSAESSTTSTATGATATATSTGFPSSAEGFGTFPFVDKGLFTFGTLSFNQFKVLLQALEVRSQTKALSVPSITTLDNQEAQIVVGTNTPVPTFARNKTTGEFEITGYVDKKTGVVLRVTPHVAKDRRVLLDIHPEVSTITRFVGDPRAQVPVTSTREADTRVSLMSEETAVIGGLIEERDLVSRREVPGLGKIPLLGRLFRFNEKTKGRTELLIFITAHVLTDQERLTRTLGAVAATGRPELFDPRLKPSKQPVAFKVRNRRIVVPQEKVSGGP